MKLIPILLAIVGAIIAIVYGLEVFLTYQATGITAAFFLKLMICLLGAFFFWRNVQRVRFGKPDAKPDEAP